ncbi:MAG: alkylated DNA repair protein (DNA oxidative demethylase) [Planctomycetota bacterium]|jgi:alkylated DNA repair protein (DNA oxidative demethylase)
MEKDETSAASGWTPGLFDQVPGADASLGKRIELVSGAAFLPGRALAEAAELLAAVRRLTVRSDFRQMDTPGGRRMSVAMTNCGVAGWITDEHGYRYASIDPTTQRPWPPMPDAFVDLARQAATEAGFPGFVPNACVINRYEPGARMTLHQDRNEQDLDQPIVSVSLGLPGVFQLGGMERSAPVIRRRLEHGDVVVWGGPARLRFHGVLPIEAGHHPATGACRLNLTFRAARIAESA